MHTGESNHRAGLRDERRRCLTSGRPRLLITGVLDVPLDLESPVLHVTRGVPERLEGNANLDLEAPRGHASLRLPQKVRTEIVLTRHDVGARDEATRLAFHSIGLHAERVHDKDERTTLVMKRVDMNLDVVITAHTVA